MLKVLNTEDDCRLTLTNIYNDIRANSHGQTCIIL